LVIFNIKNPNSSLDNFPEHRKAPCFLIATFILRTIHRVEGFIAIIQDTQSEVRILSAEC